MTVLNLQRFITSYVRDMNLRETFKSVNDKEEWFTSFGLTPKEILLATQLDTAILDVTAANLLRERIQKREVEFTEFCAVLRQCGGFEDFMTDFVRQYPDGLLTREVEIRRFVEFGSNFMREKVFSKAMTELLHYSYNMSEISKSPRIDPFNETPLNIEHPIYLKRPFRLVEFTYDMSQLVDNPDIRSFGDLESLPRKRNKVLFQKDYTQPVSCTVFEVDDDILFEFINGGFSYQEILQQASESGTRERWEQIITDLYTNESIGCSVA